MILRLYELLLAPEGTHRQVVPRCEGGQVVDGVDIMVAVGEEGVLDVVRAQAEVGTEAPLWTEYC